MKAKRGHRVPLCGRALRVLAAARALFDVPVHHRAAKALDKYVDAAEFEEPNATIFQGVEPAGRRLTGRALQRSVVLAMIKRRSAAARLSPSTWPHVLGERDHGVSVERRDPRARPADRGARIAEDDEALRPHGGQGDGRGDRTDRDMTRLGSPW